MRGIGVIGVPPPEERRWKIDRNSGYQLEPWPSKLRLVTELPGHPLRGRPHRGEHDHKDDDDLAPENLGRGHDGPRVKRRLPQEQVSHRVGRTNGDCRLRFGRTHAGMPSVVCYRRQLGKHLRVGSISHFDPTRKLTIFGYRLSLQLSAYSWAPHVRSRSTIIWTSGRI